jgi:hypothetical protein
MTGAIEITGVCIGRALVPVRRILNTRVGRFTRGPFLLIDLELKGGGTGRALCFTFMPIAANDEIEQGKVALRTLESSPPHFAEVDQAEITRSPDRVRRSSPSPRLKQRSRRVLGCTPRSRCFGRS